MLDEVVASPSKLAGRVIASSELLGDSIDGSASAVLGQGLARDLSRRMDQAFFAGMASPAPAGLARMTGISAVAAPAAWTNPDPFASAAGAVEAESAALTCWGANPADVTVLTLVKKASGSNVALLSTDQSSPTGRSISGLPVHSSPSVPVGTVHGIDGSRVVLVVSQEASVIAEASAFTSDRVVIRATMRAAFGIVHPASVAKIVGAAP